MDSPTVEPDETSLATAAGIVLAAGAARRYGATKQLALLDGRPLVNHVVGLLRNVGLGRILVVSGHDAESVERAAGPRVITVRNHDYYRGQSTSVRAGLEAAERLVPSVDLVVIVLADQPRVPAEVVRCVIEEARRFDRPARAGYTDMTGPPVALPRSCWTDVQHLLVGDAGAGGFLNALGARDVDVGVPMPADVDHVCDLRALQERHP